MFLFQVSFWMDFLWIFVAFSMPEAMKIIENHLDL